MKFKLKKNSDPLKYACVEVSDFLKVMAHPQRLAILASLATGKKTVTQLMHECKISQSLLSQYLIKMKNKKILKSSRHGKFQYYEVSDKRLKLVLRAIRKIFC